MPLHEIHISPTCKPIARRSSRCNHNGAACVDTLRVEWETAEGSVITDLGGTPRTAGSEDEPKTLRGMQ